MLPLPSSPSILYTRTHRLALTLFFVPLNPTLNGEDGESGVLLLLLHKGEVGSRQLTQKLLSLPPSISVCVILTHGLLHGISLKREKMITSDLGMTDE